MAASHALVIGAAMLTGCATVRPQADFQQTTTLISQRTGAVEVYDPSTEERVEQQVAAMLEDGLTIQEAVDVALLNNRGFQAVFQDIGVSRADVVQSSLFANPSLAMLLQLPEGGGRSKLSVGFAQQIVGLWQIPIRKRIAEKQLERAVLEVARRAVELAADVRVKCFRVLSLEQAKAIANANVQLVEESLKLAQRRVNAGEASQLDLNLVRGASLDAKLNLLDVERDQGRARIELARALGFSRSDRSWTLNDGVPDADAVAIRDADILATALTGRLDSQAAALAVQEADEEVKRQVRSVFPDVALGIEAERADRRALPGRNILADTARASVAHGGLTAPDIQSRAQRNLERRQIVDAIVGPSINITLPIWDQNQAQIAKARFKAEERRKEYEDLLDSIAQQVQEALVAARSAQEKVRFYREQAVPLAEMNIEAAGRAYGGGEQSILVLIDAQESLITLRRASLDATLDFAVAMTELERAVGGRLPEAAEEPEKHEARDGSTRGNN